MKIIKQNNKRFLFPDNNKLLIIKSTIDKIDDGAGNMISQIQSFERAILPQNITLKWCEENYSEMSQEEINALLE